ncbi:response regulator transcription factor [Raoultella ornithinolytica]|uniref:response regulator transcription factor n=1 Tax=Raoultella ornithinolytica TaxID=54291 RepID=UPI0021AFD1E5|nr:response regulator transcription factor [Raoultella ornithinolytica]MCT4737224.1 response regulator transcription factor [Raoultella ornithinolytica]
MRCLIVTDSLMYAHHLSTILWGGGLMSDTHTGGLSPWPGSRCWLQGGPTDAIILDVSSVSRTRACSLVRIWCRVTENRLPLMVIHASGTYRDVVSLVAAGASGCHRRDEDVRVLLARLQMRMLRWLGYGGPVLLRGPLRVDLLARCVQVWGHPVTLTRMEFGVLAILMGHYLRVLSRDEIMLRLSPEIPDGGRHRVLDVIVGRLRRKLAKGGLTDVVQTAWRSGYVLDLRKVLRPLRPSRPGTLTEGQQRARLTGWRWAPPSGS